MQGLHDLAEAAVNQSPAGIPRNATLQPQLESYRRLHSQSVQRVCHCNTSFKPKLRSDSDFFDGSDRFCSEECKVKGSETPRVATPKSRKTPQVVLLQRWMLRHTHRLELHGTKTIMAALVRTDGGSNTVLVTAKNPDIQSILVYLLMQGETGNPATKKILRLAAEACNAGHGDSFFDYVCDQMGDPVTQLKTASRSSDRIQEVGLRGPLNGQLNICYAISSNVLLAASSLKPFLSSCFDCPLCPVGQCFLRRISKYYNDIRKPVACNTTPLVMPDVLIDIMEPGLRCRLESAGVDATGPQHDSGEYLVKLLEKIGDHGRDESEAVYKGMRVFVGHYIQFLQTSTATAVCRGPCHSIVPYTSTLRQADAMLELPIPDDVTSIANALNAFVTQTVQVRVECPACEALSPKMKTVMPAITNTKLLLPPVDLFCSLVRFEPDGKSTTSYKKNSRYITIDKELDLYELLCESTKAALPRAGFPVGSDGKIEVRYRLVGFNEHIGQSRYSGHLVAYTYEADGKWLRHDDAIVSCISNEEVMQKQVLIALYAPCLPDAVAKLRAGLIDGLPDEGATEPPARAPLSPPTHESSSSRSEGESPRSSHKRGGGEGGDSRGSGSRRGRGRGQRGGKGKWFRTYW
jgi:hypothetical protein